MADSRFIRMGLPIPWAGPVSSETLSTHPINSSATSNRLYFVIQASDAAVVTHLGFRYFSRTGTPPTYRITIFASSATDGTATGAELGGGSFTPPADATWNDTFQWVALDSSYTMTMGDFYVIRILYASGTISGVHFSSFYAGTDVYNARPGFPYVVTDASSLNTIPIFGYRTASKRYGFPLLSRAQTTFSSADSPNEKGLAFVIPTSLGSTVQVAGMRFLGTTPVSSTTTAFTLYSGTTAQAGAVTIDSDRIRTNGSAFRVMEYYFSSLVTLTSGSTYYIALAPSSGATLAIEVMNFTAAADLEALPGGEVQYYLATRAGAGWTAVTTSRPVMELIFADMTPPSGGGGGGTKIMNVFH